MIPKQVFQKCCGFTEQLDSLLAHNIKCRFERDTATDEE